MKKLIILVFVLIFICGCNHSKTPINEVRESNSTSSDSVNAAEDTTMKDFRFIYHNPMAGSYTVEVREKDGEVHFKFETYFDYSEDAQNVHFEIEKIVDSFIFQEIAAICEKHDVYSWDGYSSSAFEGATDTESTSLYIEFHSDDTISASAGGAFPVNYDEFYDDIHEYTLLVAKANNP